MGYPQYYKKNDYKVQCDICGLTRKRSQCRLTWDGLLACVSEKGCWYPKHPNDMPPIVITNEMRPVRDARPISTGYVFRSSGLTWDSLFLNWEAITLNWEALT